MGSGVGKGQETRRATRYGTVQIPVLQNRSWPPPDPFLFFDSKGKAMSTTVQKDYLLTPYRILDLTGEHGLMCGKVLGDFGAEVIIVEPPGGHPARSIGPFYKDERHPEKSLFWFAFNTSKKSITLDIMHSEGQQLLKELVRQTDIVVESFAPGYLDDLGLSYATLSAIKPDLIFTSITPFGQTGPRSNWKGTDLTLQARSGMQYLLGDPDRAPVRISVPCLPLKEVLKQPMPHCLRCFIEIALVRDSTLMWRCSRLVCGR